MLRLEDSQHHEGNTRSLFEDLVPDPKEVAQNYNKLCSSDEIKKEIEILGDLGIAGISWDDTLYPPSLKEIYDPPPVIFAKGAVELLAEMCVAVVGSRKATAYGRNVAEALGEGLGRLGATVISGMAKGIDSAAHRGALRGEGKTIAVLGTGVDVIYPRENTELYREIAQRGLLISEFPVGSGPNAWHFPCRNRIISALSRGVVVVEAGESSGALITADFALEHGKEVMAVPGNVTSPMSTGTNRLIKQGASLVENALDVAAVIGLEPRGSGTSTSTSTEKATAGALQLTLQQEAVWKVVCSGEYDGGEVPLDCIIEKTGFPAQVVLACLTELELLGLVKSYGNGRFSTNGK